MWRLLVRWRKGEGFVEVAVSVKGRRGVCGGCWFGEGKERLCGGCWFGEVKESVMGILLVWCREGKGYGAGKGLVKGRRS